MVKAVEVIVSEIPRDLWGTKGADVKVITYRLAPSPFKLLGYHDLKNYTLESWETKDDTWITIDKQLCNLNTFCKIGMPLIHVEGEPCQLASDGYILIGSFRGCIFRVRAQERTHFKHPKEPR